MFNISIQALVRKSLPIADFSGITGNSLALQKTVFLPLYKKVCKKRVSSTISALKHKLLFARKESFLQDEYFKRKEDLLDSQQILSVEIASF